MMSKNTLRKSRRLAAAAGRKASPAAITMTSGLSLCTLNSKVEGSATASNCNAGVERRGAKRPAWSIESTTGNTTRGVAVAL